MTQPPRVDTLLALRVVNSKRGSSPAGMRSCIYDLADAAGCPPKVAWRTLEKLCDKNLIEYGTSINFPWLTAKGEALLGEKKKDWW